jgi:hypothetical protein
MIRYSLAKYPSQVSENRGYRLKLWRGRDLRGPPGRWRLICLTNSGKWCRRVGILSLESDLQQKVFWTGYLFVVNTFLNSMHSSGRMYQVISPNNGRASVTPRPSGMLMYSAWRYVTLALQLEPVNSSKILSQQQRNGGEVCIIAHAAVIDGSSRCGTRFDSVRCRNYISSLGTAAGDRASLARFQPNPALHSIPPGIFGIHCRPVG